MHSKFLLLRPPRRRAVLGAGFHRCSLPCFDQPKQPPTPEDALPLLSAGETTSTLGLYRLSEGELTLQIQRDENGDIHTDIRSPRMTTQFVPLTPIPFRILHDTQREYGGVISSGINWFRLRRRMQQSVGMLWPDWLFTPRCDRLRAAILPAESRLARGFEGVLETGNWTGVPPQFLERIHAEYDTDLVPTEPQPYTKEQALQIARFRKEASLTIPCIGGDFV